MMAAISERVLALSRREKAAVEGLRRLEASVVHDRYTDIDHELWEAAAERLYGRQWETAPGYEPDRIEGRVKALQALARSS